MADPGEWKKIFSLKDIFRPFDVNSNVDLKVFFKISFQFGCYFCEVIDDLFKLLGSQRMKKISAFE